MGSITVIGAAVAVLGFFIALCARTGRGRSVGWALIGAGLAVGLLPIFSRGGASSWWSAIGWYFGGSIAMMLAIAFVLGLVDK